jgi:hypothetical protein
VVKTAVPVDGRFEHIVLSCNATKDHAIVWITREAQKALDVSCLSYLWSCRTYNVMFGKFHLVNVHDCISGPLCIMTVISVTCMLAIM